MNQGWVFTSLICTAFSVSLLFPHSSHQPHKSTDRADTQPTKCNWEVISSSRLPTSTPDTQSRKGRAIGGTKVGNGAWGIAWVDTVMEYPSHQDDQDAKERDRILKEVVIDDPDGEGGANESEGEVMDLN